MTNPTAAATDAFQRYYDNAKALNLDFQAQNAIQRLLEIDYMEPTPNLLKEAALIMQLANDLKASIQEHTEY